MSAVLLLHRVVSLNFSDTKISVLIWRRKEKELRLALHKYRTVRNYFKLLPLFLHTPQNHNNKKLRMLPDVGSEMDQKQKVVNRLPTRAVNRGEICF